MVSRSFMSRESASARVDSFFAKWKRIRWFTFSRKKLDPGTAAIDLFDTASKIPLSSAKVPFKLISHGGIVDLEINGNRTLVSPGAPFPGACRIFAFVRDGRSVFEDLRLYSR